MQETRQVTSLCQSYSTGMNGCLIYMCNEWQNMETIRVQLLENTNLWNLHGYML